ncbi:MAG: hypothetical protein JXP34_04765 [Planctomycetes bacterium]|nr:hypothetical protein [Planctomycetota bacterium]
MKRIPNFAGAWLILAPAVLSAADALPEVRVRLEATMVESSSPLADFSGLVDEQDAVGEPPSGKPSRPWSVPSQHWKKFPFAATIDLGSARNLSSLWIFDTHGIGAFRIAARGPEAWDPVAADETHQYMRWARIDLGVTARRLKIEFLSPGAAIAEIALYEYTPEAHRAFLARKEAEAKLRAEREQAVRRAREEQAGRPWTDMPPFGPVRLVDEVDCAAGAPGHLFRESPPGSSRVRTILGRPCRVLPPAEGEASYFAFRIGRWKLLRPGAAYVLAIEYPEDQPRSILVMSGGNETSRGFHTGTTVGDALHAKYVRSNPESLRVPLSGRYETWTLPFNLHDRFPDLAFIRGAGERPLAADDGFDVAIAQFSSIDDPTSRGAAVARIALYEIRDEAALAQPLRLPPEGLPRRHILWREEMADGVIQSDRAIERGVEDRLAWYRFKANQMRFLGINTFCKDLLEFGACQHWDSTPHGGNGWVHFAAGAKDLWAGIVELMGREGLGVLPYYEYAGSKGDNGLGYERRAKPLTRDDAYTHIKWIESANADITDPDAYEDFRKMLDLTVLRLKDKARFEGIWLRPRSQLPMSFADATRERFAREANGGKPVSRADLIADQALLRRYEAWWFGKRREFLVAMRDTLRRNGLPEALVLFTADPSEPGTAFPTWEKRIVTDDIASWKTILADPRHVKDNRPVVPIGIDRVVRENLYLEALLAAPLDWGNWEVHHASPPSDPARYSDTPGVLLTHCINRAYTAASPRTFDAFRGPSGLAVIRHHPLNEHMMFAKDDSPKLGYFVCDVERAGPYCMLAEALAVANGDPTIIGYLAGGNFARGFPRYVRAFNAAFLALPALPSERLPGASGDPEIAVRAIRTRDHGIYLAVVNTGLGAKARARIRIPGTDAVTDAVTGASLPLAGRDLEIDLQPCELRALHVDP